MLFNIRLVPTKEVIQALNYHSDLEAMRENKQVQLSMKTAIKEHGLPGNKTYSEATDAKILWHRCTKKESVKINSNIHV